MEENLYKTIGRRIRALRELAGLSQEDVARAIGYTTAGAISHFENGSRKVSVADLHALASFFGTSVDNLSGTDSNSTVLRYRLRALDIRPTARDVVTNFLAFAAEHGSEPRILSSTMSELEPWAAAEQLLREVGITVPPTSPNEAAKYLKIPVFHWDFPDEMSGILAFDSGHAAIGVNSNHSFVRQKFTVAHEIGHFILDSRNDPFIDVSDSELAGVLFDDEEKQLHERRANQFAASLLMPKKWIVNDYSEYGPNRLDELAQRYEVSEQAVWFRLRNLRQIQ